MNSYLPVKILSGRSGGILLQNETYYLSIYPQEQKQNWVKN